MTKSNYQNPFDIKSTPLYYALFQKLLLEHDVISVTPIQDNNFSQVSVYNSKIFYIGKTTASVDDPTVGPVILTFNYQGGNIFSARSNPGTPNPAYYYTRIIEMDNILFNQCTVNNSEATFFVGYQITVA